MHTSSGPATLVGLTAHLAGPQDPSNTAKTVIRTLFPDGNA